MKRFRMVALIAALTMVASLLSVGNVGASSPSSVEATYEITFTNNTSGQYLTPPNYAIHDSSADVFSRGAAPSPGVVAVAERGEVPVLAAELAGAIDANGLGISGVGATAPLAPGESSTVTVTSSERRLSVVSMIICTNDGFGGVDSAWLPSVDGQTRTYNLRDFDAGAELNTENRADLVPAPFCDFEGQGGPGTPLDQPEIDGFNRINFHPTLKGVGDQPNSFDWRRGSVGTVTVTRVAQPATYDISVENITSGQYFTPVNFAAHDSSADVFSRGAAPSPGVIAVAERGEVPVLAAELAAAIDANGLGVSGVIGDAPIAPGQVVTTEFTTDENRLSIVSMIICTNDGFGGLDSAWLPSVGRTHTFYLAGYDAGAELNTENRADLVPAPFCDFEGQGGPGTPLDQPEIDGFNRINFHPTLRGVGDQPSSFDWRGPVLKVTVSNNG